MGWYEFLDILREWRDLFIALFGTFIGLFVTEIRNRKAKELSELDAKIETRWFWRRSQRSNPDDSTRFPPYLKGV
jgi:hypothetical protein